MTTVFVIIAIFGSLFVPPVFFHVIDIIVHDLEKEGQSTGWGIFYLSVWLFSLMQVISLGG